MNRVSALRGEGENALSLFETELVLSRHSDLVDGGLVQPCEVVFPLVSVSVLVSGQVRDLRPDVPDCPLFLSKFAKTEDKVLHWSSAMDTPLQLVGMFGRTFSRT